MDTSGFYRIDGTEDLFFAPNFIYAPKFSLTREEKDICKESVDGWQWFNSEELARIEYKIPTPSTLGELKKIVEKYGLVTIIEEKVYLIDECMQILSREKEIIKSDEVISEINIVPIEKTIEVV
jgi:hypothetical protein